MDNKGKKVGDDLIDKYITKGQAVVDRFSPTARAVNKSSGEWARSAREGLRTGLTGGYVDFEEALAKGQTNIDPQTYTRATDGQQEKPRKPKPYIRDINDRIERAKQQLAEKKAAGKDGDHKYREAKIAEKEQLIRDTMDRRGTNTISTKVFGYDVGLVRVGERGEFSIGKNGQPMFREYKDEPEKEPGTATEEKAEGSVPSGTAVEEETATFLPAETATGKETEIPEPAETIVEEEAAELVPLLPDKTTFEEGAEATEPDKTTFEEGAEATEPAEAAVEEGAETAVEEEAEAAEPAETTFEEGAETAVEEEAEATEPAEATFEEGAEATEPAEAVEEEKVAKHLPARTDAGEKATEPKQDAGQTAEQTTEQTAKQAAEPVEITINGKPVFVKPALTGDDVSFNGKYPEISQDLAREGVAKMAEDGTTKWAKEVGEGNNRHTVEVAMKASAGRTQVVVDKNLKGNETARTGGPRVSGGFWDMAEGSMHTNGNYNYATTMPDGKVVTCVMNIKMNGNPARINGWGDRYSAGEDTIPIEKYWHALDYMKEHGTQSWAETSQDGTTIQIDISARIDGDKRTKLDWGNGKIEATVEPERILVSRDAWMEAAENMLAGEGGKRSFEKVLADGTAVEFRMGARIDGRGAVIEENFGGREVREERDRVLVGKDIFIDAVQEMSDKQSITAKAVDQDGKEVEFRRRGKIKMFVNGQEMEDTKFQEALAEVAGVNDGKEFVGFAKAASNAKEQGIIQAERSIVSGGLTAPARAFKEGGQKNANLVSQLLSMLFQTVSRTSQTIGR